MAKFLDGLIFENFLFVEWKLCDMDGFMLYLVFSRIICLTQLHGRGMSKTPVTICTTMVAKSSPKITVADVKSKI